MVAGWWWRRQSRSTGGGGGGGGNRAAGANVQASNANADQRTNNVRNTSVNNVNVNNNNVNVNRNVNVNVDSTAAAATTAGTTTITRSRGPRPSARGGRHSAVIGSMVHTVPPSCVPVSYGGMVYQQCGSTWYQSQGSQYIVVNPPY